MTKSQARLNRSVLSSFTKTLEQDPSANLSDLFERYSKEYPTRRQKTGDSCPKARKRLKRNPSERRSPSEHYDIPPGLEEKILYPLANQVVALLNKSDKVCGDIIKPSALPPEDGLTSRLSRLLENGHIIYRCSSRFVIKVDPSIVIKRSLDLDTNEIEILNHIRKYSTSIPVPEPLGFVVIGDSKFMFLSHVEGTSLDKTWPSLTKPLKQSIQLQLDDIFRNLRQLPPLSDTLGNGHPARCKDLRRHLRASKDEIRNESDFNMFLTSSDHPNISPSYVRIIRSQLRTDHKTYLTHGDLHPGNIMASSHDTSGIVITGLIDWELSGNYPEYWEFVKAHNLLHTFDKSDWYDYLPRSIGTYGNEYLVQRAIEALV